MEKWERFLDSRGNFQLGNYIYRSINDLMKNSLDMGTLLSDDTQKLRAYKEQTKKLFKSKWFEIAEILESFEVIEKCSCWSTERESYCDICRGSRYRTSEFISVDEIQEIGIFLVDENIDVSDKLQQTLPR